MINTTRRPVVWLIVGVLTLSALVLVAVFGRDDHYAGLWRRDLALTPQLFGVSNEGMVPDAEDAAKMVDAIQIYRQSDGSVRHFKTTELFTSDQATLVFETQDRSKILEFLTAARTLNSGSSVGCTVADNSNTFYVVAFDSDLLRTVHFSMRVCDIRGIKTFQMNVPTPDGNWAVVYNSTLPALLMRFPFFANQFNQD